MEVIISNMNNKLQCDSFVHISFSPKKRIPESELPKPVTVINKDTGEKIECELVGFVRHPQGTVPELASMVSHNMNPDDFLSNINPGERELCSYLYKKVI